VNHFNAGDITVDLSSFCAPDQKRGQTWHVYPIHKANLHTLSGTYCQCDPKVESYPNGNSLVIHNTAEQARKEAN
jgi:hypothetical protein